ncbi:hypothetical protein A4X13_0g3615 [Tilletia indica]|uniref:Uncharacterized protein n=1 Tax=Tilletia indica TaxID=43049 RepID=A0A8T8T1S6_9BASI|nr:hypothetical protein A4X13_0g3615 [Tilletia indica]
MSSPFLRPIGQRCELFEDRVDASACCTSVSLVHPPILIKAGPPIPLFLGTVHSLLKALIEISPGTLLFQLRSRLHQDRTPLGHAPPDGRHTYPIKTWSMPFLSTGHPPASTSSPGRPPSLPTGHPPLQSWSAFLPSLPRYAVSPAQGSRSASLFDLK